MGRCSNVHVWIFREASKPTLTPLTVVTIRESCKRVTVRRASIMSSEVSRNGASNPTASKEQNPDTVNEATGSARDTRGRR